MLAENQNFTPFFFLLLQRHRTRIIQAKGGEDSSKVRILGRRGEDTIVEVPTGITVYNDQRKIIGELNEADQTCIAAGGGMGGCSGTSFIGKRGQEHVLTLDLKLIADVGLVWM